MLPPASLAYLDALGIDVWVRRELMASRAREAMAGAARTRSELVSREESVSGGPAHKSAGEPNAQPSGERTGEPTVTFVIRCVRFGRVLALIDDSLWGERRFFLDVARAMHGPGPVERDVRRFDWPQLKSATGGMEAAGRAFRAYLETQAVEGTRVLAAGARVRELVGTDREGTIYLDRALRGLTEKKSLWQRIRKLS